VPDFLALVGNTADGFPGLEGRGEKSAAEVLSVHPHFEDIPEQVADWNVKPRGSVEGEVMKARPPRLWENGGTRLLLSTRWKSREEPPGDEGDDSGAHTPP
jgi:5'-3' exonuclease